VNIQYEDGSAVRCVYCGKDMDLDRDEPDTDRPRWYHISDGHYTCDPTDPRSTNGTPKCMWDEPCGEPGPLPLKEEVRDRDTDEVIETNYLGFLCQRHLKVVAYLAAERPVPHELLDPFVIEEMPG